MEKSETLIALPMIGNRRRRPLKSRTVDTLLHILQLCSSSNLIHTSDKGIQNDVPLDNIPNDSIFQQQTAVYGTRVVLDTQEADLCNKHVESGEHDHNILGENKDLSQKTKTSTPPVNFAVRSQDNSNDTNEDVEEGEISGDVMDDTKSSGENETDSGSRVFEGTKTRLVNDSDLIPLSTEAVENGGKIVVNRTTRNLVDYSEIAVHAKKSHECAKQTTFKLNATKNHNLVSLMKNNGAQNNKKRQGSCIEEERKNKKSKKLAETTTCSKNITLIGEHLDDASQNVRDDSAKKDACNEKKRKRVLTKERKAKKKMNERIKRARKNRELGIRRLRLEPVIKEKKIVYCRHYMNGRCHEGEKCKFSHDITPLTKSKPCCHFARHTCMKGDDCPYDHQLSKYPCNNYQTTGSCNRGSDCMFSHEAQPSEASLNESNESKSDQKPPSNLSPNKVETKSFPVSKSVDITPKPTVPPKGMTFLSQGKLPLISRTPKGMNFLSQEDLAPESRLSPKVVSEVKEITRTPLLIQDSKEKMKMPSVIQDSAEITKTPTRGINFLSFGKKSTVDNSSGGYSFKISNRVEKSQLSDVVGEGLRSSSSVNTISEARVDFFTDRPSSSKTPIPMMSFISSTSQKALQSTLAFATQLESGVKSKV